MAVEPGDTAVRVFIDRVGRPEEDWDSSSWGSALIMAGVAQL